MLYGCIGEKLGHSFSKIIHNKIADYNYELKEIAKIDLADFMSEKNFKAINVTIPYKRDVIPYLYHIDEKAKKIGAVNTIVNKDGRLYGYNTDYFGMKCLAKKNDIDLNGKKVLILGSGGTSKTAYALASDCQAKEIYIVSRSCEKSNCITYEDAYINHHDAEVIINTTPCGMFPNNLSTPIDIDRFERLEAVIDAIYNPLRSELVSRALKKGLKAAGGLYMLVAQAVYAAEKFLDKLIPESEIDRIYTDIFTEKENIVLIGMPGCGKTTLGKMLSEITSKEFIDTDKEIELAEGKSIPQIFSDRGETEFRKKESNIISSVSAKTGCIIATGGGAVLDDRNIALLKQNGRLYFIERPLKSLVYTDGRPLAPNIDAINALYQKRYPIYLNAADTVIKADGNEEQAIDSISLALEKYRSALSCKDEDQISQHKPSATKNVMKVEIKKCSHVKGTIKAPPSKSMAHRLLICALLAEEKSTIHDLTLSEDICATIDCIKALGAEISLSKESGNTYTATICRSSSICRTDSAHRIDSIFKTNSICKNSICKIDSPNKVDSINSIDRKAPEVPLLNCRESGSTLRFFIPIALALCKNAIFTGSQRLFERSVSVYEELAKEKGFELTKGTDKIIAKGSLPGGIYTVSGGISSQFISGLLFALPLSKADSTIKILPPLESSSYIALTLEALKAFGIEIERPNELTFNIKGNQQYRACDITIEGDYSNAAFFEAFNHIGGNVQLTGLSSKSSQGDKVFYDIFDKLQKGSKEPISLADCPDLGPILFALSAALYGGRFTDTRRLKIKESDRALSMKLEIEKFGCPVHLSENEVIIGAPGTKTPLKKPSCILDGHNDHRIVMSLAVLSSITGGTISGAEAVSKSLPDFFERLKTLGVEIKYV